MLMMVGSGLGWGKWFLGLGWVNLGKVGFGLRTKGLEVGFSEVGMCFGSLAIGTTGLFCQLFNGVKEWVLIDKNY